MKKRKIALLLTVCLTLTLFAGCGDKKETEENSETTTETASEGADVTLKDYNADELVTLGDYKGLEVTVAAPSVDEVKQQTYVENIFQNSITEEIGIKDRAVEDGDLVYISYVGKKDDVAFEGGTTEGTFLKIGSKSYIEGFEEGLIGVMPGETVDLNLTFPEPYENNPDLAGAPVVFTVTVIYIAPEITDETVAALANENFSNVEELNQYVYDQLMRQAESEHEISVENAVIEALLANTDFGEIPQELIDKYTRNVLNNMTTAAAQYGYDVDSYAMMLYGADAATITAQFGEESAKQGLVFQAIANAESLQVSDEELEEKLQQYVTDYGLNSVEELLGDTSREDYRDFFMFEKVIGFLVENANVTTE